MTRMLETRKCDVPPPSSTEIPAKRGRAWLAWLNVYQPESQQHRGQDDRIESVLNDLLVIRSLPVGWDGYGAERIRDNIVDAAAEFFRRFASEITLTPSVVPMTRGRLQFEWNLGARSLELEFESPRSLHYLMCDEHLDSEDENVIELSDAESITRILRSFFSEQ